MENEELDFETEDQQEETPNTDQVTLTKKEYTKLQRKAFAYDANKGKPEQTKEVSKQVSPELEEKIANLELKTDGYSESEIAFIKANGGRQALENPYVKEAINAIRQQKTAEEAVISMETNKSDIERKYTEKELEAMPIEELEKALRTQ